MKAWLTPCLILAAILAACALNCRAMARETARWRAQLDAAEQLAIAEDWDAAKAALSDSYDDWSARQTWLRIVAEHGAVNSADAMYRRCAAFAATEEPSEFRAEMADLKHQLHVLAEMERFSVRNIL